MIRKNRYNKSTKLRGRTERISERSCLGCRSKRHPRDFARLVCDQQGIVRLDRLGNAPGRGAYICFETGCLRKALNLSRLTFAFKRPVVVPEFDALYQALSMYLDKRLRSYFQLAQRAGILVSGTVALHRALARAQVSFVVLARDTAKSRADEYRSWCAQLNIPCITLFSKEELGQLIGRSNRSAVGFTASHFYRQISIDVMSLEKLRSLKEFSETNSSFCPLSS